MEAGGKNRKELEVKLNDFLNKVNELLLQPILEFNEHVLHRIG